MAERATRALNRTLAKGSKDRQCLPVASIPGQGIRPNLKDCKEYRLNMLVLCRYPYNESEFIVDRVARGIALFMDREEEARMKRVSYCDNAPSLVLAHPGRFHYMLSRDPVTGSFSDYAELFGNRTDIVGNWHGEWHVRTFENPEGTTFSV